MILYRTKKKIILWRINKELLDTVSRGNTLLSSNKAERPVGKGDDGLMEREGEQLSELLQLWSFPLCSPAAPCTMWLGALETTGPGGGRFKGCEQCWHGI